MWRTTSNFPSPPGLSLRTHLVSHGFGINKNPVRHDAVRLDVFVAAKVARRVRCEAFARVAVVDADGVTTTTRFTIITSAGHCAAVRFAVTVELVPVHATETLQKVRTLQAQRVGNMTAILNNAMCDPSINRGILRMYRRHKCWVGTV